MFRVLVPLVHGLALFYFWCRLVRDTRLPRPWYVACTCLLFAVGVGMMLFFLFRRRLPQGMAEVLAWPVYGLMGLMVLLLVTVAFSDLIRLAVALGRMVTSHAQLNPARRLLFRRILGGTAGVSAAALGGFAVTRALGPVIVNRVSVELARLPRQSHGTTIVQLTDMHIGVTIGRAFVEDIVRRTNALRPDIIAITGDLVDSSVPALRDTVAPLGELRSRHGVYFVTGNHEMYSGVEPWVAELSRLGIRVLRNERVSIGGPAGFDLAGVEDYSARHMGERGTDVAGALRGIDPSREVVLLAHQPRSVHEAARHGVGLQLSGHTHGGQIWPWGLFVRLQQPYRQGLYRHGNTQIYVSQGTGYWGPPMRLGTHAEITHVTLHSPGEPRNRHNPLVLLEKSQIS
jgi:predicted MPP superfamily phosphohydrolase